MKRLFLNIFLILVSLLILPSAATAKYIIAIDAGHGGKDSGAIGPTKLYEKTVNLSIAIKLAALMEKDSSMKPVLTRRNDSYISVAQRSDIARKNKANLLISIHADAAPNRSASGASVWVLSNKRADTELGRWLEQHEKQSELLGGAGDALAKESNQFLSQTVLDLQFAHAQRMGYLLAERILGDLNSVTKLHKRTPEHASLGVLRSPDIPSVLVEVGFISNRREEQLLRTDAFQQRVAQAIYRGVKKYVNANPLGK